MKFSVAAIVVFAGTLAQAVNHRVTVGTGGLVFNPSSVTADVGDTIEFVVQGVYPHSHPSSILECEC
jgi:plastocyanin